MSNINGAARSIVEKIRCGDIAGAAEVLDHVFHTLSRSDFQKLVAAVELANKAAAAARGGRPADREELSHTDGLRINSWSVYSFKHSELFEAASR